MSKMLRSKLSDDLRKRASYSIKLWYVLWTTWSFLLLLAITLILSLAIHEVIHDSYFTPPNIYVFLTIAFLNGLVLSSFIGFPSLVGVSVESYPNLVIAVLVGLVQWFLIYQLGRLWLLNWKPHKWCWKLLFPVFLVDYYAISGLLSISLFAITIG